MLFQPFQAGLRPIEKVDQPHLLKTVFPQPNKPETVDLSRGGTLTGHERAAEIKPK